jgi:RNA polymerase sigma-70 factor (ECF subfamily)
MADQDRTAFGNSQTPGPPEETFICLLTANHKRIYGFIRAIVPHLSDADDIMQETVMTMWRRFSEFQPGTNFAAWGIAVAKFRIQKFRSRSGGRMVFSDEALEQVLSQYTVAMRDLDARIEALEQCLAQLKERDRRMVRMRYEQNLRADSMAEHVGLSTHAIYKAMARIHSMLLRCMRRRIGGWETA